MKAYKITIETGETFSVISPYSIEEIRESIKLRMQTEVTIISILGEDDEKLQEL